MKVLKFFGKFIAFLYSIVFFAVLNALLLLICFSNLLNPKFYGSIMKNLDLSQIKIADIIGDKSDKIEDKATTAEDFLIDKLEESGVPTDTAKDIIKSKEVKEFVGTFCGDIVQYFIFTEKTPQIDSAQVNKIINELHISDELEEKDIKVDEIINKINDQMIEEFPVNEQAIEDNKQNMPKELEILFDIADKAKLIIILSSFIITSYLLLSLLAWSLIKPFNYIGIPSLITGVIFLIIRFAGEFIISMIMNVEVLSFVGQFSVILRPVLISGIIFFVSGLLLIILQSNISSIKTKDKKNEPNFDIENETNQNNNEIKNEDSNVNELPTNNEESIADVNIDNNEEPK